MSLRESLIKLGSDNPDLRGHLRPILDHLSVKTSSREMDKEIMKMDKRVWDGIAFDVLSRYGKGSVGGDPKAQITGEQVVDNIIDILHDEITGRPTFTNGASSELEEYWNDLPFDEILDILYDQFPRNRKFGF